MFGMEEELEYCGVQDGEKSLRMCLLVSMQYANVTDGRTDGQTNKYCTTA